MSSAMALLGAAATPTVVLGALLWRTYAAGEANRRRLAPLKDVEREVERRRKEGERLLAAAEAEAAAVARDIERRKNELDRDIERARETGREQAQALIQAARAEKQGLQEQIDTVRREMQELRRKYGTGQTRLRELEREIARYEEHLEDIDVGLYRPHFTYDTLDSFKFEIEQLRRRASEMVRQGTAATCDVEWRVEGNRADGKRMIKQQTKVILRAFNAEAEAAIANVTWNNYKTMRTRLEKAFEVLNDGGSVMKIRLSPEYLQVRLMELQLTYEAAEKEKEERERQREQRAAQREEEKVQRELARAKAEAEKEEERFQKALEKARAEAERAVDAAVEEKEAMARRIAELQAQVAEAHERRERAIAQAQLTRVGHVYFISNTGAFGDGVLKIGMTRRLEPMERIKELGDASVPFPFDVHGLLYSEDAPGLETKLHDRFWDRRVNWANDRKEFFRVSVAELQTALRDLGIPAEVHSTVEAREYRETVAAQQAQQAPAPRSTGASTTSFSEDPFEEDEG